MSHNIEIRDMADSDIPALANLMMDLGYPTTIEEMRARIMAIKNEKDYKTLVVAKNDVVIAMAGMLRIYFWEQNGWHIKIQAFVVKQSCRVQGVGATLMKGCEKWAKEAGATLIALNCGNGLERTAAHQFYQKMGFELNSSGYRKYIGSN